MILYLLVTSKWTLTKLANCREWLLNYSEDTSLCFSIKLKTKPIQDLNFQFPTFQQKKYLLYK